MEIEKWRLRREKNADIEGWIDLREFCNKYVLFELVKREDTLKK